MAVNIRAAMLLRRLLEAMRDVFFKQARLKYGVTDTLLKPTLQTPLYSSHPGCVSELPNRAPYSQRDATAPRRRNRRGQGNDQRRVDAMVRLRDNPHAAAILSGTPEHTMCGEI